MRKSSTLEIGNTNRERKEALGQFLTPGPVGDFMASLLEPLPTAVRLLDAGAGAGALTAAFVRNACQRKERVRSIHATAYEIDPSILPALGETLDDCDSICRKHAIRFSATVHQADFIWEMAEKLAGDFFSAKPPSFNVAIANPPYKKINTNSPERMALRSVGLETSNLYTAFVGLIGRLLEPGGQLAAITPRSFCNGPYFQSFREDLLAMLEIRKLHVFDCRDAAFRKDAVLQENVVFHAVKGSSQPATIIVSSSSGENGGPVISNEVPFTEIVLPTDRHRFIHIPTGTVHASAKAKLANLPANLEQLGLTVSTGRVVDFRSKSALRANPAPGTAPLFYPCHFNGGTVHWPKLTARKPNAIVENDETRPLLVPAGIYLLTKRFTSKEERRRVVACMVEPSEIDAKWFGFENHLNYFHSSGRGLKKDIARGLFAFLNSTVVDQYFRCFSGHTQVNATDLRKLTYPDRPTLEAMGRELINLASPQEELDDLVESHLHASNKVCPNHQFKKTPSS